MLTVRCFAALREVLGRDTFQFAIPEGCRTAADVLTFVTADCQKDLPKPLLVAINRQHATLSTAICDGDEVAFFPPVSGG